MTQKQQRNQTAKERREKKVRFYKMKAAGISNREICAQIGIAEKTGVKWAKDLQAPQVGRAVKAALLANAESMARDEKTPPLALALFAIALKMYEGEI